MNKDPWSLIRRNSWSKADFNSCPAAAWWIWGIAHIYFLISPRNRLIVMTQWLWSYAPPSNPTGWAVDMTMPARQTDKERLERS